MTSPCHDKNALPHIETNRKRPCAFIASPRERKPTLFDPILNLFNLNSFSLFLKDPFCQIINGHDSIVVSRGVGRTSLCISKYLS